MNLKKVYLLNKIKRLFPEYKISDSYINKLDGKIISRIEELFDVINQNKPLKVSFRLYIDTYFRKCITSSDYPYFNQTSLIQATHNIINSIVFNSDINIYLNWKWVYYLPEQNVYKFSLSHLQFSALYYGYSDQRIMLNKEIIITKLETLQSLSETIIQNIIKYKILLLLKGNLTKRERQDIIKTIDKIFKDSIL